jgi:hypothetical protein
MYNLFLVCEPLAGKRVVKVTEIEFSALAWQALSRRIATVAELERHVNAWQGQRNAAVTTINWRFTTDDARIKLKRLSHHKILLQIMLDRLLLHPSLFRITAS